MPPRMLTPHVYCRHAWDIDPEGLRAGGVDGIMIDLDNTLVPRTENEIPSDALDWSERVRRCGMSACLVSNNWHERVQEVATALGFAFIPRALKPFPQAFRRGCRILEVEPTRAIVVGDQIFTDVLGGRLAGMTTVLVEPLAGSDLPHTVLLRRLEAAIMAGREPVQQFPEADRKEPIG